MTTTTRPFSHVLAPALLGISALLVAWNWVLRPDRVGAWADHDRCYVFRKPP